MDVKRYSHNGYQHIDMRKGGWTKGLPNNIWTSNRESRKQNHFKTKYSYLLPWEPLVYVEDIFSKQNRKEESIIDFVIVCDKVLPHFEHMIIDEEKEDALVNFNSKKPGKIAKIVRWCCGIFEI